MSAFLPGRGGEEAPPTQGRLSLNGGLRGVRSILRRGIGSPVQPGASRTEDMAEDMAEDMGPTAPRGRARRILLASANQVRAREIQAYLVAAGDCVIVITDLAWFSIGRGEGADLILLDAALDRDLATCRSLVAKRGAAMIMLATTEDQAGCILALEAGADDAVTTKCSLRELLARSRAVLRRKHSEPPTGDGRYLPFGHLVCDGLTGALTAPGHPPLLLSAGQLAIVRAFANRPGEVLTRDELVEMTHGLEAEIFDRAVDCQIFRLRAKLSEVGASNLIQTNRGTGYMLDAPRRHALDHQID